jgi:hypothetical protein
MPKDAKHAIDEIIRTAYSTALSGYGISPGLLSEEAQKRIKKTLRDIATGERKVIENETDYHARLKRLELASFSPKEHELIVAMMKKKHVDCEEAYRLASGNVRN